MNRPGPMPPQTRAAFDAAMAMGRRRLPSDESWTALERAHVLSQPWPWAHVRVHAAMLRAAVRERDATEVLGQVVRLAVAGPGSATGRYPVGNTGRSRVGLTEVMPVPADLVPLLPLDEP